MTAPKTTPAKHVGPEILTAINAVRAEAKKITCTMPNFQGGRNAKKIMSYNDVVDAVELLELKHGLCWVGPVDWQVQSGSEGETRSQVDVEKDGEVRTVSVSESLNRFTYRLYHVATQQYVEVISWGRGLDPSDKDLGKAATYALKYSMALLYRLKRESGDASRDHQDAEDPDTSFTRRPHKSNGHPQPAAPSGPAPAKPSGPQAPVTSQAAAPAPQQQPEETPEQKTLREERSKIDEHFEKVIVPSHGLDPVKYKPGVAVPAWDMVDGMMKNYFKAASISERGQNYFHQRCLYNWFLCQLNAYPDALSTTKKFILDSDMVDTNKAKLTKMIDEALAKATAATK